MKVEIGKEAKSLTFQAEFPETVNCTCGGETRLAMAFREDATNPICHLYNNEGKGGFWPHDCIAVAIYFCKECCDCVTEWNQA